MSPPISYAGSSAALTTTSSLANVPGGSRFHSTSADSAMGRARTRRAHESLCGRLLITRSATSDASVLIRRSTTSPPCGTVTPSRPIRSVPSSSGAHTRYGPSPPGWDRTSDTDRNARPASVPSILIVGSGPPAASTWFASGTRSSCCRSVT
ncbi:hypothetical protein [Nonomuraea salmonea]|uniref:hypothetical protein n=1 Tax=Nonomuraea salmonea TaxID=46181 RepID=UPI0031EFACE4